MKKNILVYSTIIISVAVIFTSCKVTQTYDKSVLIDSLNVSNAYRASVSEDTTTIADIPWQQLFTDEKLQVLIAEGIQNNLDLKVAIERINELDALFKQSKLAFLPTVNTSLTVGHSKTSLSNTNLPAGININRDNNSFQLAGSTSWEADIWGRLASSRNRAYAQLLQADATKRSVLTQIVANVANLYYQLLAFDKNLAVTKSTIDIRKEDVETMKALKEAAYVTGASVVQSEANLYAAQVSVPDLELSIKQTENAICLLLGKDAQSINRNTLDDQNLNTDMHTGIPLQLLQNRPDVEAAELSLRAAFENTNVAKASFYPTLSISATIGLSSLTFENWFKENAFFYNAAGTLSQVIFNRGLLKTQLKQAESQQLQAYYSFRQTLLTAGQEVSNALFTYQTAVEKEKTRSLQLASLEKAVEYNKELLKFTSATNYTDVLLSEQNLLSAQLASVSDKLQELQAVVELYRALGGGWK